MPSVPTVHDDESSDLSSISTSSSNDSTWGAASLSHPHETPPSWEEPTPDETSSPDKERQLLLLMLLAQVCALHDPTPRTFIVHVLELFERSILDRDSIRFLFELGLVPHHSTLPKQALLLEADHSNDEITNALLARASPKNDGRPTVETLSPTPVTRTQEASAIRSHLQGTTAESPATHSTKSDTPSHSWAVEQYPLSLSRYQREFRQVRLLNRGGFGAVYQARNVMDGRDYAIKRVAFEGCGYSTQQIVEAIREVQCLAQCDHVNCVRYYTSWLEPSWMTGSNASTVEQSASQRPMLMGVSNTDASSSRLPRRFSFSAEDSCWEDTTHDSAAYWSSQRSKDDSYLHGPSSPTTNQAQPPNRYGYEICLYIQMQLCHPTTLVDWIRQRNSSSSGPPTSCSTDQALNIFRQIASGIAHVHEKGILHRDLKPANIFAGTDGLFKIGDFGLSKLLAQQRAFSSDTTTAVTTALVAHHRHSDALTTGIGTASYAAPEQLDDSLQTPSYGPQADVFSLGLILLELMCCFGTEHERLVAFRDLRRQGTVPEWLSEQYPEIASLILKCTDADPSKRPTAHDLASTTMTIVPKAELENDTLLKQKDRELERQRSEIEEKDRIIEDLRRQVDRMSGVLLQNGDLSDNVTRNDDNQDANNES